MGTLVAWVSVRYRFPGKRIFDAMIDLPFALPTEVAGIALTALYGPSGWIGHWLEKVGIQIVYTFLGIVVALVFVGLPFVVRVAVYRPRMDAVEGAARQRRRTRALNLGASGWQRFWRVTLPNIRWAWLYGVLVCSARAMGECGAVSVVSGHIRGRTSTPPLHV